MANANSENLLTPFNFSYPISIPYLEESLLAFGQMNPILIARTEKGDCIIDGFRRYKILDYLGRDKVFHKVYPMNFENAFNLYLQLNLNTRTFNIIEKIRICRFAISNKISIWATTLKKVGLGNISANSLLYDFIERQDDRLKDIIIEKQLTTTLLERLSKIGDSDVEKILIYIKKESLTHQQSRELISDLYHIFMKEGRISIIVDEFYQIPYEELRRKIRAIKNPMLKKMEDDFANFIAQFNKISILPPEYFEGNKYKLEAFFEDEKDIDSILQEILRLREEWKKNPILK
jgi:hypothetical protein